MDKNKKGISAVVATVLIILITIAAITIIWAAILPMINNNLESGAICLDAVSQVQLLNSDYTCVASDGDSVSIQVKRLSKSFDLEDIQVLISSGGDTNSFMISNDTTTLVPTGTDIPLPNANEERVYIIDTSSIVGSITEVKIAPVVSSGSGGEICDVSATRSLYEC